MGILNLQIKDKRLKQIESLLPRALVSDRLAVRREIDRFIHGHRKPYRGSKFNEGLLRLEKRIQASVQKRNLRKHNLPELRYNAALPIIAKKHEIVQAISQYPVIIVSGETGSGKTTQIPKFCLAAGRGIDGMIGHTQPRRIAAMTVARRIAEELGQEGGRAVGYKIRFKDRTFRDAYIKVMTDGILLAETQRDRHLSAYDTIIVDEAHERSLNIDFILGILQMLLDRRDDLRVIITSATIDTQKFSKAFGDAPVIEVSGRMYPVEVRYHVPETTAEDSGELTHVELAVQTVSQLQNESASGDILVFMPTEQDIRDTCELIEATRPKSACILPLYARLTADEQAKVFGRMPERKIIVATNVAETSITLPGIKYVIDSGLARILRYSPQSRTTSLPVMPVSQSSADQRKGRCGRIQNGVCIRLFSEEDYLARPRFTPPEIIRANLAEVILRMIALKLGDIADFPFIDRPDTRSISDGFDLLFELGAVTKKQRPKGKEHREDSVSGTIGSGKWQGRVTLTEIGRLMAKIPFDPRLSRMLIEAKDHGCLKEIAVIASALSIRDPRERPVEKASEADRMHGLFNDPFSDFVTRLNIWNRYHNVWKIKKSTNQVKRFCRQHFLSYKRMREWQDIYSQITTILKEFDLITKQHQLKGQPENLKLDMESSRYQSIHKSILSGFLSNIAQKKEKNIFRATKGREAMIFPGSGLFTRAGNWIVAAEMVQTSKLFARTVANIDNSWLEELGKDLCRRTYLHPHWEKNRGEVVASEQVSLFGLIIVPQRSVPYGPINADEATDIFIRSALIYGDVKKPFAFMKHNQHLIDSIKGIEDRIRRRDLLIGEDHMLAFYKERLKGVYNIRKLSHHLTKRGHDRFLRMKKEDLMLYHPNDAELLLYPQGTDIDGHPLEFAYHFEPGEDDDGVTLNVPISLAPAVPPETLDWLVPGLFNEKIEALIKGLPKKYRKKLVPVKETVEIITKEMTKGESSLLSALGEFIFKRFNVDIPASAWPDETLPDYLKMRIAVTAPDGKELHAGRDTSVLLQKNVATKRTDEYESFRKTYEKTGIVQWDFGDLPEFISNPKSHKTKWVAYPALEAAGEADKTVNLRLFRRQDEALSVHKSGVSALFKIHFAKDLKFLKKSLKLPEHVIYLADYFGGAKRFEKKLFDRIMHNLFYKNIRSKKTFYTHAKKVAPTIIAHGQALRDRSLVVLAASGKCRNEIHKLQLSNQHNHLAVKFFEGLIQELGRLVPQSFIDLYEVDKLGHIERYIQALEIRAHRALVDFEKDQAKLNEVITFNERLSELLKTLTPEVSDEKRKAIEEFFWMVEEYKVSIFAQELKTAFPVSKKRLDKKIKEIERMI